MTYKKLLQSEPEWTLWRNSASFPTPDWQGPERYPCVAVVSLNESDSGAWNRKAEETYVYPGDFGVQVELHKGMSVYSCDGRWLDPRNTNRHKQAIFVVAAPSKAAICRAWPILKNKGWIVTHSEKEIAIAATKPMALFACGLNAACGTLEEVEDYEKTVRP